jgi:hydroxypyruvate reductase
VNPQAILLALFRAALEAAQPEHCLPPHLPPPPRGRTIVLGAGKAAAAMARTLEPHWPAPLEGLVVTRDGHGAPTKRIAVIEASHPLPDRRASEAARRMIAMLEGLQEDDLVLFLGSGGGSALLALPAPGLTLEDKRTLTNTLLRAGATIHEINAVRKHLSAVKGGRLAQAAYPARFVSLLISDVAGDDSATIASGPGVADPSTLKDARAVLAKYRIEPSPAVRRHLADPLNETPKPGDARLARASVSLIATPKLALEAAARTARSLGIDPLILGDGLEGEAQDLATAQAARALALQGKSRSPAVLLSGGEATVVVSGPGRGGPNSEFVLALALALGGAPGIFALACDTDGIDGVGDNAGAFADPTTVARARERGLEPSAYLAAHDSYDFFAALGDLVLTGPTRTNVNDFRAILVLPPDAAPHSGVE